MSKELFYLAEGCLLEGAKAPVTISFLNRSPEEQKDTVLTKRAYFLSCFARMKSTKIHFLDNIFFKKEEEFILVSKAK